MGLRITLRLAGIPYRALANIQNYFPAPVTGTIVSASIAFMENTVTGTSSVSDGNCSSFIVQFGY